MPSRTVLLICAIVVVMFALVPLLGSRYAIDLATQVIIYALFALSLNVLIGYFAATYDRYTNHHDDLLGVN